MVEETGNENASDAQEVPPKTHGQRMAERLEKEHPMAALQFTANNFISLKLEQSMRNNTGIGKLMNKFVDKSVKQQLDKSDKPVEASTTEDGLKNNWADTTKKESGERER